MISPPSNRPLRCCTVCSVIWPAGSMIQMTRGLSPSVFTRSSRDSVAVAPSLANAWRGFGLASNTTHLCPAFINRRAMLPPIRPSPMMAICMCPLLKDLLFKRCVHRASQLGQARIDILEMDAQHAAVALNQDVEIAARLGRLHYAETVRVARNLDVIWIVACDLQEHSRIWTAFISLSGRMLKARPKAQTSRRPGMIAHLHAYPSQCFGM